MIDNLRATLRKYAGFTGEFEAPDAGNGPPAVRLCHADLEGYGDEAYGRAVDKAGEIVEQSLADEAKVSEWFDEKRRCWAEFTAKRAVDFKGAGYEFHLTYAWPNGGCENFNDPNVKAPEPRTFSRTNQRPIMVE